MVLVFPSLDPAPRRWKVRFFVAVYSAPPCEVVDGRQSSAIFAPLRTHHQPSCRIPASPKPTEHPIAFVRRNETRRTTPMRGLNRLRSYAARAKLLFGEIVQLDNWKFLRERASRARKGEAVAERPVLHFRSGLRITMVPGSFAGWDFLFREIFLEKCYRPTSNFIPRRGWTIVDLGANMGFFTCQCSFEEPGVRVVSVEPLPLYAETLQANIEINRFANTRLIQGAICGDPGLTIPIEVWYTEAGELKTGTPPDGKVARETINAKGYTLPEVFQIGQVEQCDLLKVDIEGAEYDLFAKIPAEIWRKIHRVVMEVHNGQGHHEKEIVQVLERNGFEVQIHADNPVTSLLWAVSKSAR